MEVTLCSVRFRGYSLPFQEWSFFSRFIADFIQDLVDMVSMNSPALRLFLVLLLLTGCGPKGTGSAGSAGSTSSSEDGEVAAAGPGGAKSKKIVPVKQNVKEIEGNWVVVVSTQQSDHYRWIMKFKRGADGKYTAEFVDSSQDKNPADKNAAEKSATGNRSIDKPDLTEIEVNGDAVQFSAKTEVGAFNFTGTFQHGFIRGTIRSSPFEVMLTRLLPTDEKSLAPFGSVGLPPGADAFAAKMKSKDFQPEDLLNTVKEYRVSPLAQDMYATILNELVRAKGDEVKIKEVIDAFLSSAKIWGVRWEARVNMTIGITLLKGRLFPRQIPAYFDAAEKNMGEDLPAFQDTLKSYREAADINILIQDLANASSPDDVRADAYARLVELLKKQPFNAEVLAALANEAERINKTDEAIEYLSEIVALPLLEMQILSMRAGSPPSTPTPADLLKKLWAQKHGDDSGHQKYVDEVYHARIDAFLEEIKKSGPALPEKSGKKTVLVEFFTGMMCPPCVSADMTLAALTKTFSTSDVIVVRFHQHIPGPDGLVNQDSEERAAFYQVNSAPLIVVDGHLIDPRFYAGPIQMATNGYGVLRKVIDPRLAEKSDVTLQLSAAVSDGQLTISVEASGVPEDLLPSCRLRMAIVENVVHTNGPIGFNGVRDHENVVREMPGRSKGIPAKNGELKYSLTMPVADIQQNVINHISRFEAGRRAEFPPEMKPPIRGPLSLVAWVQNGNPDPTTQGKSVLQCAMIPITGETGFGAEVAAKVEQKEPATPQKVASASPTTDGASETTPPPPALPE